MHCEGALIPDRRGNVNTEVAIDVSDVVAGKGLTVLWAQVFVIEMLNEELFLGRVAGAEAEVGAISSSKIAVADVLAKCFLLELRGFEAYLSVVVEEGIGVLEGGTHVDVDVGEVSSGCSWGSLAVSVWFA